MNTGSVERPEELPGSVVDKDPGEHDPRRGRVRDIDGQRPWPCGEHDAQPRRRRGNSRERGHRSATARSGRPPRRRGGPFRLREPPTLFRLTRFRLTSSIFAHSTMQLPLFGQGEYERNRHLDCQQPGVQLPACARFSSPGAVFALVPDGRMGGWADGRMGLPQVRSVAVTCLALATSLRTPGAPGRVRGEVGNTSFYCETLYAEVGISPIEDYLGEGVGRQRQLTVKVDVAFGDPAAALAIKEPRGWLPVA